MNTMDLEAERETLELGSLGEHSFSWWGFQKGQNQDQYWILHSAIQLLDNDDPRGRPESMAGQMFKNANKRHKDARVSGLENTSVIAICNTASMPIGSFLGMS